MARYVSRMADDTRLADRIRKTLARRKGVTEKAMFGGLAFPACAMLACGLAAALAAPARATERLEGVQLRGITAAVSTAYASPAGELAPGERLSHVASHAWPIRIDLGHRFTSALRTTFSLSYAPVVARSGSDLGRAVVAGGELAWLFATRSRAAPWLGLGAGFETFSLDAGDGPERRRTARGWAFPMLRAGVVWRLSRHAAVGPVIGVHFGRFTSVDVERPGAPDTFERVTGSGWHHWTEGGMRVLLDL
jgi:hypothetical protein